MITPILFSGKSYQEGVPAAAAAAGGGGRAAGGRAAAAAAAYVGEDKECASIL